MGKWYKELDKKFSWSFFGFFVGILGLIFGLYTFYHKEKPNVQFEVVTNTDVFNLNENIGKLQILFNDENVLSIDTTLKLVTVKFINSGDASINKEDFDKDYLVNLNFENFIIADKPNIIDYSNSYLKDRFSFSYKSNSIQINPIILDENDFVIFKILLIGARNEIVQMTSSGKIAGQKNIPVFTEIKNKTKNPFWYLAKVLLSGFLGVMILGGIGILLRVLKNKFLISKRSSLFKKFISNYNLETDKQYDQILEMYKKYGYDILLYIIELSKDLEKFEKFVTVDVNLKGLSYKDIKYLGIKLDSEQDLSEEFNKKTFIDKLILEDDFVENIEGKGKFKDDFINKIEKLKNYIKN